MFKLNSASENKLASVQPAMQKLVRRAAELSSQPFQIVQGNRTQAEQNRLFEQGRSKPGPIVTWTRNSNHLGGRAIDYAVLVDGKINWETISLYGAVAAVFKKAAAELNIPINWGGDWKTKDFGHIELQKGTPSTVPAVSTLPKPAVKDPLLERGAKGPYVYELQTLLNNQGASLKLDAQFGPATEAAVLSFQTVHGLVPTKTADQATWAKLRENVTPKPSQVPQNRTSFAKTILEGLDWKAIWAAGMVGNLMQEAGPKLHKTDIEGDNGHAHGLGQWQKTRFTDLQKFADARGAFWTDFETQIRFVDHEMHTTEKRAWKLMQEAVTLEEAVDAGIAYFRPSAPRREQRIAFAKTLI